MVPGLGWGLAALLGAYLLGSVPTAYLLGRWLLRVDITREGSGNIGASNVARRSPALALLVLLLDGAKGWLSATLGLALDRSGWLAAGMALAAVVGHCWSIYRLRQPRKGGKGVATLLGAVLALLPLLLLVILGTFLVATPLTGYRAAGTLVAAIVALPAMAVLGAPPPLYALGGAALAVLLLTHRTNLQRIRAGQEERGFFPSR